MKKIISAAIIAAALFGCDRAPEYTQTNLSAGDVRVYDFGEYKLHAYNTADAMGDYAYLVETPGNLIGIEGPSFKKNVTAWREYISAQSKPMKSVLLSYHPNPAAWYDGANNYATSAAMVARTQGEIGALVANLGAAFGPDFDTEIATTAQNLTNGVNTVDGMEFIITDNAGGYTIEIPAMNVLYVHMLGADSHSILTSIEHMDALIKQLREYKAKKYALIISAHHAPEAPGALDTKIAYIETAKKLAAESENAAQFMEKMKDAFPNYTGVNYLEMTAGNLFK